MVSLSILIHSMINVSHFVREIHVFKLESKQMKLFKLSMLFSLKEQHGMKFARSIQSKSKLQVNLWVKRSKEILLVLLKNCNFSQPVFYISALESL
jgi:hypothetical protein